MANIYRDGLVTQTPAAVATMLSTLKRGDQYFLLMSDMPGGRMREGVILGFGFGPVHSNLIPRGHRRGFKTP
jgi:hypothetical protein